MMQGYIDSLTAMRDQIDRAIGHLGHAAALLDGARADIPTVTATRVVVTALPPAPAVVEPSPRRQKRLAKRAKTLKARLTGTSGSSRLVLSVVKGGADTLAQIATDAKLKPSTARAALLALEEAGRVTRTGKSRATRYVVAK